MKKFLGLIFAGAMIFGGVGTVQALDIQPRGPQLDPVTKSTTKDCKAGTLRLFTLTHSAYFVPNTLGTQCSVQNHKIGAKNISSKITGIVVVLINFIQKNFWIYSTRESALQSFFKANYLSKKMRFQNCAP